MKNYIENLEIYSFIEHFYSEEDQKFKDQLRNVLYEWYKLKNEYVIYGVDKVDFRVSVCNIDHLNKLCNLINTYPERYYEFVSDPYYDFIKYLWVVVKGESKRFVDYHAEIKTKY